MVNHVSKLALCIVLCDTTLFKGTSLSRNVKNIIVIKLVFITLYSIIALNNPVFFVLTFDYSMFKQVMKSIVQNLNESV